MMKFWSESLIILVILSFLFLGLKPRNKEKEQEPFTNHSFTQIHPDIFLFKDICNVYVLKSGNSALLIDAGSGQITNYLKNIGIKKVEGVLHTHYHRDQCIGSVQLKKAGAKIAIGESESELLDHEEISAPFNQPEEFLLNGELPGWGKRLAPFARPGVDRKLADGETWTWNQYKISVINTPGHTQGSVSYIVEAEDEKFCFTGDLIMKGGYARDLYSMQWTYLQNPGLGASILSLKKIKAVNATLLLPSHGSLIDHPSPDIEVLTSRLEKVNDAFNFPRAGRWNWTEFVQVSKHVIQDGGSTSQIILSDSGEALLFDCGKEFSLERLRQAKAKFGIKRIDVIIPSHWHFDHIDGITRIAKAEGAKVWAWEGLAEHLKHPENFPTTCWTMDTVKIDRILKEREEFEWGGYSFKVYHHPVHMEQQMGLYAKVDGLNFYLTADGTGLSKAGHLRCSIHCYNGITLATGLIKTAQSLSQANPYMCLSAHSNVFAVAPEDKTEFINWAVETTGDIKALLPPPHMDLGYDPYWVSFYPARVHIQAGEETKIAMRLKNYTNKNLSGKYRLKGYGSLIFENNLFEYELLPGETKDIPVFIKTKDSAGKGIHILTADIEYDNQSYGEYPQAYIQIDE